MLLHFSPLDKSVYFFLLIRLQMAPSSRSVNTLDLAEGNHIHMTLTFHTKLLQLAMKDGFWLHSESKCKRVQYKINETSLQFIQSQT
jgi:hypothetical protein